MKNLYVFDFDGTLTLGKPIWEVLNEHFDCVEQDKEHYNNFKACRITCPEWICLDVGLYNSKGANRNEFEKAMSNIILRDGVCETLTELGKKGDVMMVSDGIDLLLDHLDIRHLFDYVYINEMLIDSERITGYKCSPFHFEKKPLALKAHINDYDNIMFAGDGSNDMQIVKYVNGIGGITIAVDGAVEKLKKEVKYQMKTTNLTEILDYV